MSHDGHNDLQVVVADMLGDTSTASYRTWPTRCWGRCSGTFPETPYSTTGVTAGVETDAETVSVRLADGVLDEQQEAIFGRGERGMSSGGIGLYLVRTLVDQYGGRVWVDDDSTGAVFIVELERQQRFSAAAPTLPV